MLAALERTVDYFKCQALWSPLSLIPAPLAGPAEEGGRCSESEAFDLRQSRACQGVPARGVPGSLIG